MGSIRPDPPPRQGDPPTTERASSGRRAALLLALGGLAIFFGSFATWDTCPNVPCGGERLVFFVFWDRSGMDVGPGLVTVEIGFLLAVAGSGAFRRRGTSPFRIEAIGLALLALLIVAAYSVRTYVVPEFRTTGPRLGPFLVVVGAIVAAAASARLRPPDRASRAWALARRPALTVLVVGMEAWLVGLSGYIGFRIEPLTCAVVLVALGVGLWPGRLAVTRVKPPTLGVLIVLYGALALIAALFSDVGPGLLEGFPFAVLFGIVVLRVLELPVDTPQAGSSGGRTDAALATIGSTSGLRVAALLLTGAAMALLLGWLVAPQNLPLRLYALEDLPYDPAWLAWMLAAGLAIGGGMVIALVRAGRGSA
jgi:hypothetical protein